MQLLNHVSTAAAPSMQVSKRVFLLAYATVTMCLLMLSELSPCIAHAGYDHDHDHGDDYGGYGADAYGGGDPYGGYGGEEPPTGSAKAFDTNEEIKAFLKSNDDKPVVVGYFDAVNNAADKAIFDKIVETEGRHYEFAYTTSKEALEELKYDGCAVVVYPPAKYINEKLEKSKARFPSKTLKADTLKKFIHDKSLPLVGLQTFDSMMRYNKVTLPLVTVFGPVDIQKNPKGFQYLANRARKVAVDYKGKLIFTVADSKEFSHAYSDYGIVVGNDKDISVGLKAGNTYYKLKKPFSSESLAEFVKQFFAGELIGIEKDVNAAPPQSQEDEEDSGPSAVVKSTLENFKADVVDTTADVMIEFYAPWCGHCKHLKPKYEKVAKHYEGDKNVKIMAFDATASELPKGISLLGYPSIYFIPAATKEHTQYMGAHDTDAMIEFIEKSRTTKPSSSEL